MGTRLGPKSTPGGIGRDPGTISISGFKAAFLKNILVLVTYVDKNS